MVEKNNILCIFVPGIKGSELFCTSCDRRSWPPHILSEPFNLARRVISRSTTSIEKLLTPEELNCLTFHKKKATNVIKNVKVLNGLFNKKVYGEFLSRLKINLKYLELYINGGNRDNNNNNYKIDLLEFPYDWTKSNSQTAYDLYKNVFLKEIKKGFYKEFIIIAHSMGGIVTRYMLEHLLNSDIKLLPGTHEEKERIKSSILLFYGIGVPHYGCIRSLFSLVSAENEHLSCFSRNIASLYDMIPYNDLEKQIIGYNNNNDYDRNTNNNDDTDDNKSYSSETRSFKQYRNIKKIRRRTRSDVFLKTSIVSNLKDKKNIENDIHINPRFWENGNSDNAVHVDVNCFKNYTAENEYLNNVTYNLIKRFPILAHRGELIKSGLKFHCSLNTSMKPTKCIYILVNAVGVNTPSHIDSENNLFKTCKAGDGVVCSNIAGVDNEKNNKALKKINSLFNYFKFKNVNRKTNGTNNGEDDKRESTGKQNTVGSSCSSGLDDGSGSCNIDRTENSINDMYKNITDRSGPPDDSQFTNVHITMLNNIDIFKPLQNILTTSKHMMWKKMYSFNNATPAGDGNIKVLNEFRKDYEGYLIELRNTDGNQCLFSIKDTNSIKSEKIIAMTLDTIYFDRENKIVKNNGRNSSNLNIKINTRCDGSIFNKLQFIITGHYFISNVAFLKGDVGNVDGDCRKCVPGNVKDTRGIGTKTSHGYEDSYGTCNVSLL